MKDRFAQRSARPFAGFSLIEVTIALGLISFCLIALLALLPAGLRNVKETRERIAGASCIEKIAASIRNASLSTTPANTYHAVGGYTNLTWSIGGAPVTGTFTNISLTGDPASAVADQRLVAYVKVVPPANGVSSGSALITVAWPNRATWNAGSSKWSNAIGSLSTWMIFTPQQ